MALTIRSVFCLVCSTREAVVAHSAYRMPVCARSSAAQAPATFSARSSIFCASCTRFSCGNLREMPARSTPSKSRTMTSLSWFSELRRERLMGRNPEPSALASEPVAPEDVTPLSTGLAAAGSVDGDALVARPLAVTAGFTGGTPLGFGVRPKDATFSMLGSGLRFVTESTFMTPEATSFAAPLASCLTSVLRVLGITDRCRSYVAPLRLHDSSAMDIASPETAPASMDCSGCLGPMDGTRDLRRSENRRRLGISRV